MPRSYNRNRVSDYNFIDAKLDNPHLRPRDLENVVREANGIPPRITVTPIAPYMRGIYSHAPIRRVRSA